MSIAPTWSRLSCIAMKTLRSGVPKEITPLALQAFTNTHLNICNYLRFILYRVILTHCSQKQKNAKPGKETPSTVPEKSRPGHQVSTVKTRSSVSGCLIKTLASFIKFQNINFNSRQITFGGISGTFRRRLG